MARTDILYGANNWQALVAEREALAGTQPGFLPRQTAYGSIQAEAAGLQAIGEFPDMLIDPADFYEVIQTCHEKKIFAMYHEETHGFGPYWYQNGLGYCWAWGLAMATMNCRAIENQRPVKLAPATLGWLVDWRNDGYYCDKAIQGARLHGIASRAFVPSMLENRPYLFEPGWEEDALKYRPMEWWECETCVVAPDDPPLPPEDYHHVIQQRLSILATGRPLYCSYLWWTHALCCVGVEWSQESYTNIVWLLRNSHGERGLIKLKDAIGIPTEAYGVRVTSRSE